MHTVFYSYFSGQYNQHQLSNQLTAGVIKCEVVDGNCLSYVRKTFVIELLVMVDILIIITGYHLGT